jgi:hypothetical protein
MFCAIAGTYQLSIKNAKTKETLPGSPFTVTMEATNPVASHSTARFGAGADKANVAVAGQALTVTASLNDKFGNHTDGMNFLAFYILLVSPCSLFGCFIA